MLFFLISPRAAARSSRLLMSFKSCCRQAVAWFSSTRSRPNTWEHITVYNISKLLINTSEQLDHTLKFCSSSSWLRESLTRFILCWVMRRRFNRLSTSAMSANMSKRVTDDRRALAARTILPLYKIFPTFIFGWHFYSLLNKQKLPSWMNMDHLQSRAQHGTLSPHLFVHLQRHPPILYGVLCSLWLFPFHVL